MYADKRQLVKKAADGWWQCMEKLGWIVVLPIRLRVLLSMSIKEV
jgi:hypothetical protein